jgi:hypothetical protein
MANQPSQQPKFSQQHMSLILSAVAVVVVAGIAVASFKSQSHSNVASNSNSSTTSGSSVSNASGKSSTATGNSAPVSTSRPGGGSYSQSAQSNASQALYFSPDGSTVASGQTLTVQIRENSGTTAVNAVQANLSYPADKLKFNSIDTGSSAFSIAAPSNGGSGKVAIARGTTTAVTGDQLVASVSFTVIGNGMASLAFTGGSALVTSADHKNLVDTLGTATYHLQ